MLSLGQCRAFNPLGAACAKNPYFDRRPSSDAGWVIWQRFWNPKDSLTLSPKSGFRTDVVLSTGVGSLARGTVDLGFKQLAPARENVVFLVAMVRRNLSFFIKSSSL